MGAACDLQMLKESRVWFGAATLTHMKRIYIYSITEKNGNRCMESAGQETRREEVPGKAPTTH
jgi:hypothetical protein